MENFLIRKLTENDYHLNYIELLSQLTDCPMITFDEFKQQLDKINSSGNTHIFVIENNVNNKLIASGTILIENKFIHNMSSVGHLEDIIVDTAYQGKGIGKLLIDYLTKFAKEQNCYKCVLHCSEKNILFYEKNNFKQNGIEMDYYF